MGDSDEDPDEQFGRLTTARMDETAPISNVRHESRKVDLAIFPPYKYSFTIGKDVTVKAAKSLSKAQEPWKMKAP